jgi:hypothetical protein
MSTWSTKKIVVDVSEGKKRRLKAGEGWSSYRKRKDLRALAHVVRAKEKNPSFGLLGRPCGYRICWRMAVPDPPTRRWALEVLAWPSTKEGMACAFPH